MNRSLDQLAEIAQQAVRIGAKIVRTVRPQRVTEKSDRDTYTDVDLKIERQIRAFLTNQTPEIGFLGEEEGRTKDAPDSIYVWSLDPIDGTSNYVHGIPLCAVQIALMKNHHPVVAAIVMPYTEMQYWAAEGMGAYANDSRLQPSATASLAQSIVSIGDYATGRHAIEKNKERIALTAALAEKVERIRMFGSAAYDLAWTAEGRVDATVILSNNSVDLAPGILICQESGATVTDRHGRPYSRGSANAVISAPLISDKIIKITSSIQR